jgi:hypothetical protein
MAHPRRIRTAESKRLIERLRKICMALPEATEKEAWAEPTWRVSGKMFAQMDDHHHGGEHCSVWLPSTLEVQESLVAAEPKRFFRPAYVGHKGWIGVVLDTKPDWAIVEELVRAAYRRIAPAKLVALLDAPASAVRSSAARAASARAGTRARSSRARSR